MYKTEDELSDKLILDFISDYEKDTKTKYKKMQDYYESKNAILSRTMIDGNDVNNKIANNYAGYITDMATGYFIGRPVTYTSTDDELIDKIQDIYNYNDEQDENNEIAKQISIKGRSFEILYLDETDTDEQAMPRLRFNKVQAENMMAIYDYNISPEMIYAIRWYDIKRDKKSIRKIEVYSKDKISFFEQKGKKLSLLEEKEHYFNIVPVVEFINNEELQGDFEKVLSLIDAYDKAESDSINNLEYFANCYMYLVGMKDTDINDIKEMKQLRVLLLDEKGEAGFLTKEENSAETENISNRLKDDIHKFAMVPDLSDEHFSNNSSGIAMLYKLLGLEQLAVKKERKFKKALQRRLEIICNYLNFKGANYNYKDIQMKFMRNIPVNDKENVEIVQMLQSIISKKSSISYLKMIDDVNAELENIEKEKEAYMVDLDKVSDSYES
ncbi:MAG: phage portal protein [Peptoanaerobacter stomatis]|uniref:phage portal protein n=1 Tax=Peptoanaerobacter stomatis TaxID=796937 RepID=UPI003FA0BDC9